MKAPSTLASLTTLQKATGGLLYLTGWVFLLFGALNYYTHIGLILNTMPN